MTSNQHGPYTWGYTRDTMARTNRSKTVMWSQSDKSCLSSDRGLQLDLVKPESLVTVYQSWYGEYVPGPCTNTVPNQEY